jgi:PBP1b-binding outer membrane lipoprotein LpoB
MGSVKTVQKTGNNYGMKTLYFLLIAACIVSCNNSTDNAAPTDVDKTQNNDTPFVQNDSGTIPQAAPIDSMNHDSSKQKQ